MLGVLRDNALAPTNAERRARTTPVQNTAVLRGLGRGLQNLPA